MEYWARESSQLVCQTSQLVEVFHEPVGARCWRWRANPKKVRKFFDLKLFGRCFVEELERHCGLIHVLKRIWDNSVQDLGCGCVAIFATDRQTDIQFSLRSKRTVASHIHDCAARTWTVKSMRNLQTYQSCAGFSGSCKFFPDMMIIPCEDPFWKLWSRF